MKTTLPFVLGLTLLCSDSFGQGTCDSALPIGPGIYTVPALTGEAPTLFCVGGGTPAAGAWYQYTPIQDTTVNLTTDVLGYLNVDTRFHVYSGVCGALVCVSGDDDSGPNYSSIATFNVSGGVTYTIAFDSYWTASGFTFQLTELDQPGPPTGMVSFTPTPIPGMSGIMGFVDMNNDGRDDAIAPGQNLFNIAYQQVAPGFTMTTYPTTPADNTASWSFAIGDWDSNGYRDLLYGGGSGATFMKANGDGTAYTEISFPQYIFCQRTNFVDVNNDGHLDAFSCHDVDANVAFINDGNGNLVFTQGGYGTTCGNYGSIWTDYDNDGLVDLFIAKCGCDPVDLLMHNNDNGSFLNVAPALGLADSHQSWSSAWGDFDNDGDMDVLIGASSSGYHKLMRNNGDGTFTNVTAGSGMDTFGGQSIEWTTHDFNNDGWLDILGGGAMHYNNGNMTFSHDATAPANHAIGDMNNDGFLDIGTSATYYRNNGNGNNWIRINPQGITANRDAIGARVEVTSDLGTQIRDIRSGDGFRYMSFIGAHFGLGSDETVQQVVVKWPDGTQDVIENPAINTVHGLIQGVSTGVAVQTEVGLTIAPNPVSDVLMISGVPQNTSAQVIDATGKLVLQERTQGGRLHVGALPAGVYQLILTDQEGVHHARFTKQ